MIPENNKLTLKWDMPNLNKLRIEGWVHGKRYSLWYERRPYHKWWDGSSVQRQGLKAVMFATRYGTPR